MFRESLNRNGVIDMQRRLLFLAVPLLLLLIAVSALTRWWPGIAPEPLSSEHYYRQGLAAGEEGRWEAAISAFDRALALDAENGRAYHNRAVAKRVTGDLEGAVADYDRALAVTNRTVLEYAMAFRGRGAVREVQEDLVRAESDYSRAISLAPDYALAYLCRALVRLRLDEAGGARSDLQWVIQNATDPDLVQEAADALLLLDGIPGVLHQPEDLPGRQTPTVAI